MSHIIRSLHATMEDDENTTTITTTTSSSSSTTIAVKFEKVATLLEWIKAYRKKAREDVEESDGTEVSRQIFAAHYPQFFTRERTGMFPLYRLLAPQVRREREREKIPLAAETSSVVFCARFSPRAVFCADGDILLSFSIWYVRNSWTKNARRTI